MIKEKEVNRLKKLSGDISSGALDQMVVSNMYDCVKGRKGMSLFDDQRIALLEAALVTLKQNKINKIAGKAKLNTYVPAIGLVKISDTSKKKYLWRDEDSESLRSARIEFFSRNVDALNSFIGIFPANRQGYIHDLIKAAHKVGYRSGLLQERHDNEPVRIGGMD